MRLPDDVHTSGPWRIREIAPDFEVEDVWALPVHGSAEDFPAVIALLTSDDPAFPDSAPARFLWWVRDLLGKWFGLGRISVPVEEGGPSGLLIPGGSETSLMERLPDDLRGTVSDFHFRDVPFTPLFRTDREFAAEISNQTVHGVLHLAWVDQGEGRFQGQMAVYVKPRGRLGKAYMALIKPFRYAIVYPALMRQFERRWEARGPAGSHSGAGGSR